MISPAKRRAMDFSPRARECSTSHRIASALRRSGRTSTGTCPVRYEGDDGWIETGDNGEIALSENLIKTQGKYFAKPGTSAKGHGRNFFDCVKTRSLPVCNHNVMRHSHIACFAAQLSWELGRKLRIDPETERFINDDEANRRIRRATSAPWSFNV